MKQWRVLLDSGTEIVVDMASVLEPDEDEFGEVLAQEVAKLGYNSDLIDDWWPNG